MPAVRPVWALAPPATEVSPWLVEKQPLEVRVRLLLPMWLPSCMTKPGVAVWSAARTMSVSVLRLCEPSRLPEG